MNLADLSTKIETRITSDTGAGGLWETSGAARINAVEFDVPMPGSELPLLIVRFPEARERDAFSPDGVLVTIDFELLIDRRVDSFSVDSTILDRLRGLFHRWTPTLSGVYTAEHMRRITGTTRHDTELRVYLEQYQIGIWWNTIGPV